MGDPYDSFEGRIGIVDLIDKRILYHRGQCGVKSGCRFLQIPELDQKRGGGEKRIAMMNQEKDTHHPASKPQRG